MKRWPFIASFFALSLLLSGLQLAYAAPQINWGEMVQRDQEAQQRSKLEVDLRKHWESTLVNNVQEADGEAMDPAPIWEWPAQGFSRAQHPQDVRLRSGERMVARFTVFSEKLANDFLVTVQMPRIDVVHISYRHDLGAWTTLTAGDRIPMDVWPLADRQPSFDVPLPPGQLDVVMQFVHRGVVEAPVLIQNNRAFLDSRTKSVLPQGILIGFNLVMAVLGVLLAANFWKASFLSVAVMGVVMSWVLFFGSGLGGLLLGTDSAHFNDRVKFVMNSSWAALLPWAAALALNMRAYSKLWWWGTVIFSGSVSAMGLIFMNIDLRDSARPFVNVVALSSLLLTLALVAWSWFKGYCENYGIVMGVLLFAGSLVFYFFAFMLFLDREVGTYGAVLLSLLASVMLNRGLFLHHRMGRQVLARANISPLRDVLTGLLNRDGMQAHLYKVRERMRAEQIGALFLYVPVLDADAAIEELGEQGFEAGLVQMAASLSTSVSGPEGVGRISRHAFGICVVMQPDPAAATRLAQKILSRAMLLAANGAPLCSTVRLAMAWLPINTFRVDGLEQRCLAALDTLESGKRIAWVGGAQSHKEAAQILRDMSTHPSDPPQEPIVDSRAASQGAVSSTLYERIHRIEREMLGPDTKFFQEEADRMSQALNEVRFAQDQAQWPASADAKQMNFQSTEQSLPEQKPSLG